MTSTIKVILELDSEPVEFWVTVGTNIEAGKFSEELKKFIESQDIFEEAE